MIRSASTAKFVMIRTIPDSRLNFVGVNSSLIYAEYQPLGILQRGNATVQGTELSLFY